MFALYSQSSHLVEIFRVTYEVERIISKEMSSKPISLVLLGSLCIIGFADGHLGMYKTDTMQEI